jgi:hypothetical protein
VDEMKLKANDILQVGDIWHIPDYLEEPIEVYNIGKTVAKFRRDGNAGGWIERPDREDVKDEVKEGEK